jgi:hypothetical protein
MQPLQQPGDRGYLLWASDARALSLLQNLNEVAGFDQ